MVEPAVAVAVVAVLATAEGAPSSVLLSVVERRGTTASWPTRRGRASGTGDVVRFDVADVPDSCRAAVDSVLPETDLAGVAFTTEAAFAGVALTAEAALAGVAFTTEAALAGVALAEAALAGVAFTAEAALADVAFAFAGVAFAEVAFAEVAFAEAAFPEVALGGVAFAGVAFPEASFAEAAFALPVTAWTAELTVPAAESPPEEPSWSEAA